MMVEAERQSTGSIGGGMPAAGRGDILGRMRDRRSSAPGTRGSRDAGRRLEPSKTRRPMWTRALPIVCASVLLSGVAASAERAAPLEPPERSTPASTSSFATSGAPGMIAHAESGRHASAPVGWYCTPGGCGPRSADPVRGATAFAAAALVAGLLARRRPGRAR
jgi:hypothetical protein